MELDQIKDRKIQSSVTEGFDYSIDTSQIALLYEVLSKYANPVGSLVRELTTNAFDAHIEAGVHREVTVRVIEPDYMTGRDREFQVQDYGVGISPDRMEKVYRKFLASTKRQNNDEHGAWGLGSKSPFSYTNLFSMTTVVDGIKYEYALHKGSKVPRIDKLDEYPTNEDNGTLVSVPIKSGDSWKFKDEIKKQLAYFDNIEHIGTNVENDYTIYQGQHFLFRPGIDSSSFKGIHLCLGKVFYPIDQTMVELPSESYNVDCPIALKFNIGDIPVTYTRESIEYTDEAVEAIEQKYIDAKEELEEHFANSLGAIDNVTDYFWAKKQKKEPVLEIADGVELPNIKSIIKYSIKFPKYDVIPKLPGFIDTVSLLYKLHKVVNNGIAKTDNYKSLKSVLDRGATRQDPYQLSDTYLLEGSYSTTTNKYMDSIGEGYFYLVRKKAESERPSEGKILDTFGFGDRNTFDKLTEEEIKAVRGYTRDCIRYFLARTKNYSDIEVPQAFKDARKGASKKGMFDPTSDEYNPDLKVHVKQAKCLGQISQYAENEYKVWEPTIGTLMKHRHALCIYGFQQDQELIDATSILLSRFYPRKWEWDDITNKKQLMILKIAKNKEEFITEIMENAIHVNEFYSKKHKWLIRALTYLYIYRNLDEEASTPLSETDPKNANSLFKDLGLDRFRDVYKEAYRVITYMKSLNNSHRYKTGYNQLKAILPKPLLPIFDHPLYLDYSVIETYEECQRYFAKYPLVYQMCVNLPDDENFKSVISEEMKFYVKGKSPVNPNLEARLVEYKANKQ